MLIHPGDLIPVQEEAIQIPWTKRKSQILHYLHKGSVTFQTYVYDTNVGDISSLSTYFNPERWTVRDLNDKFAQRPESESTFVKAVAEGGHNTSTTTTTTTTDANNNNNSSSSTSSVLPRLLLCPEDTVSLSEKEKQTMQWVILQSTVKAALKMDSREEQRRGGDSGHHKRLPSTDDVFWESSSLKPPSTSDVWRNSLSDTTSPFLWEGGSFFESSWPSSHANGTTGGGAHTGTPGGVVKEEVKEDFLVGESLLQNITNDFLRNETLV